MSRYIKALAALLGAISTWGVTAAPDGVDSVEWFGLLGVLGTGLLVLGSPPNAESAEDFEGFDDEGRVSTDGVVTIALGIVLAVLLLWFLSVVF